MGQIGWVRVISPHFVAGFNLKGLCAPIISYMRLWTIEEIRAYCAKKRWILEEFMENDTPEKIFERDKQFVMALASKIATAVFTKLQLDGKYTPLIRFEQYEGLPYPWVTIAFLKNGAPAEKESSLSLPMARYMDCANGAPGEVRSELATLIYKNIAMMLGMYKAPEKK